MSKRLKTYVRKRKSGWHAIGRWTSKDGAQATVVSGPMPSKEDAEASLEGVQWATRMLATTMFIEPTKRPDK